MSISDSKFPFERMQKFVDDVGGGVKYIGYARPGRATTEPFWIIQRETTASNDVETLYPVGVNGNPSSDENFKWSDRLTLTYSAIPEVNAGTLTTVTMASNNSTTTLAKVGDTVTLTIVGTKFMRAPTITIAGHTATTTIGGDSKTWTATHVMLQADTEGVVPFTVQAYELGGRPLAPVSTLTSGVGVTYDKTGIVILSVALITDTTIEVTLSEVAKTASITKANAGGFTVVDTDEETTTYAVSEIAPGVTDDKIILTLADVSASDVTGITVKYTVGGNGTVQDLSGNLLATNPGVAIPSWA